MSEVVGGGDTFKMKGRPKTPRPSPPQGPVQLMTAEKLRSLERRIYGRELGPLPSPAPVEPCHRCGRDTLVRRSRRACGPCLMRRP